MGCTGELVEWRVSRPFLRGARPLQAVVWQTVICGDLASRDTRAGFYLQPGNLES